MAETSHDLFTVAVFQDVEWARRGIEALLRHGFEPDTLSILGKDTAELSALCQDTLGSGPDRVDVRAIGSGLGHGPLLGVLQGSDGGLTSHGIGGAIARAGFQRHDGHIFEILTGRGGVLVAVRDDRRAADALATFHAYGGGNAAIGAWHGRV